MKKIITAAQMNAADAYTIKHLPIASYDLMEKAATLFTQSLTRDYPNTRTKVVLFCGSGNNGGDGWAIARMLYDKAYEDITVYDVSFAKKRSPDNETNEKALGDRRIHVAQLSDATSLNDLDADLIVDAIFGTGINRSLDEEYCELIKKINAAAKPIYAVDVPSGFPPEGKVPREYKGIRATKTITFQLPKLNFFMPESSLAQEDFEVVDIGLMQKSIDSFDTHFFATEVADIRSMLHKRKKFSYKNSYGHALLVAGAENTMGAAILNAMAALYAGAGMVTACIPENGRTAINTKLPEVMYLPRAAFRQKDKIKYTVWAVGSGLGEGKEAKQLVKASLEMSKSLVLDADALNIIATENWLHKLPENAIITPHMKEFDRLFGQHTSWSLRLETARQEAKKRKINIVLKNQYTFICDPLGKVYINTTGNPAMSQAGMGDVLTGIIASFLAQKYLPLDACKMACFIHGASADTLAKTHYCIPASAIARQTAIEVRRLLASSELAL